MSKKDPYKDSPYDASGMPLGADTVDYDVKEDVAAKTVFDKPVEQISLVDMDYTPRPIDDHLLPHRLKKSNFNSAIKDEVNVPEDIDTVDFEDPDAKAKLIVKEAEEKGIGVQELPKTEKPEKVDAVKKEIAKDEDDSSFLDEDKDKK